MDRTRIISYTLVNWIKDDYIWMIEKNTSCATYVYYIDQYITLVMHGKLKTVHINMTE